MMKRKLGIFLALALTFSATGCTMIEGLLGGGYSDSSF